MYLNLSFEDAWNNIEFQKIINAASSKYVRYLDPDELCSLQMGVLWRCLIKYKNDSAMKFTTYLYTQIGFAIKNLIKKNKKNPITGVFIEDNAALIYNDEVKIKPILSSIPDKDREILEQRFFYNMTMKEIGEKNGYSKETARRKLSRALNKCNTISDLCVFR